MSRFLPRRPREQARRMADSAYLQADRVLDYGQGRVFRLLWTFIPEPNVAKDPRFQQVFASRFLSDAGQQALAYCAIVAVVRNGGSAFDVALVGIAALIPPMLLGLHGGAVADALPKRIALAAAYNLQALFCFLVPAFLGTDMAALILLLLVVNSLGQISGPSESSVLPLITSPAELSSAASLVNLASAAGAALGTGLLAPILVKAFGVKTVMYVAGACLLLAASRVFDLPTAEKHERMVWRVPKISVRQAIAWLAHEPAVGTMIMLSVLAGTANIVVQTLAPRYVVSVLQVDAENAVYVFAPSAVGLVIALLLAPLIMRRMGERRTALLAFVVIAVTLSLLGLVGQLSSVLDPINPLRLLVPLNLGERLRTASLLALPLGFGVALAATSTQTYVNRRVPMLYQGRTFALQSTLKNGTAIIPLLILGATASAFGVDKVLLFSPLALLALAGMLLWVSSRLAGIAAPSSLQVVGSFFEQAETPVRLPDEPPSGPAPTEPSR